MLRDISKQKTKGGNYWKYKNYKKKYFTDKVTYSKVVDQTIIKSIESLNNIQVVKLTYVYTE